MTALVVGGVRYRIDLDAPEAWLERHPDATPEEIRQVLLAHNPVLGEFAADDEEERG